MQYVMPKVPTISKILESANTFLFMTDVLPNTTSASDFTASIVNHSRCIGLERDLNKIKFSRVEGTKDGNYLPSLGPVFEDYKVIREKPGSFEQIGYNVYLGSMGTTVPKEFEQEADRRNNLYCVSETSPFLLAKNIPVKTFNAANEVWHPFFYITKKPIEACVPNPMGAYLGVNENYRPAGFMLALNLGYYGYSNQISIAQVMNTKESTEKFTIGWNKVYNTVGIYDAIYRESAVGERKANGYYPVYFTNYSNQIQGKGVGHISSNGNPTLSESTSDPDSPSTEAKYLSCCYRIGSEYMFLVLENGIHFTSQGWSAHDFPEITINTGLLTVPKGDPKLSIGSKGATR